MQDPWQLDMVPSLPEVARTPVSEFSDLKKKKQKEAESVSFKYLCFHIRGGMSPFVWVSSSIQDVHKICVSHQSPCNIHSPLAEILRTYLQLPAVPTKAAS